MPIHYLNQYSFIVNWTCKIIQWNFNQILDIFIQVNTFKNAICTTLPFHSGLSMLTQCGLMMPHWWDTDLTLTQVMACCMTAPSHYLNQCWLLIKEGLWHWSDCLSQWVPKLLFCIKSLKILLLKILLHHPGANKLICQVFFNSAIGTQCYWQAEALQGPSRHCKVYCKEFKFPTCILLIRSREISHCT